MIEKTVYVSRVRDFQIEIGRLNKKAVRIGVEPITIIALGKVTKVRHIVTKDEDGNEDVREFPMDVEHFRLSLPEPANCQWEPIAKITPLDNGDAFAEPMPAGTQADADRAKSLDPQNCDHCHTSRDRAISYVVRHKTDRRVLQLGRNCFGDYVGKDTLRALEFQAVIMANMGGDEDGFWGEGGGRRSVPVVKVFDCVLVAEVLRRTEGWKNNVKNEYSGDIEVEGTHRIAGPLAIQISNSDPSPRAAKLLDLVTDADRDTTAAIIARMQDETVSDEFGQTLQNVSQYDWVPNRKANLVAYMGQFLQNADRRAREAQLNAKRVYVGTVGQREVFSDLTCIRVPSFDTDFGTVYVNTFEDADGNVLIWKTGSICFEVGCKLALQGTVKDHSEYNGTKQTILSRCKELDAEALAKAQAKAARAAAKAAKAVEVAQ